MFPLSLPCQYRVGNQRTGGGVGNAEGGAGENGTLTGKACPEGLYGTFCKECPSGTYKNVVGSDESLCQSCSHLELPHRAIYISVRGGVTETPCPYKCISDRYHMPHCYTALEELIYTFGGPWLFGLLLVGLLLLLAVVLSVARMRFVGVDDLPGPAPTQHGSQIDHSFPFLESLNEVLETNRAEESQSHVHRMYFMGPNTFSEPWHLPHSPPDQLKEIVYEGAFNRFVDEVNLLATYQWWEGSVYSILSVLAHPLAWSWLLWRRRIKLQRLREFVRSEYDHACLRSCRSRARYEGIKVAATPDLMLAYVDFFLGGDEKRSDLPPRLHQRFPLAMFFGGDGSYIAPLTLHSDNILTSLMSQSVPPTTWYRLVAGVNAHLRLVRRGCLRKTFRPVLRWLESHGNRALRNYGLRADLACFQATACGYHQYGLLICAVDENIESSTAECQDGRMRADQPSSITRGSSSGFQWEEPLIEHLDKKSEYLSRQKKSYGLTLDIGNIQNLEERRDLFFPFSLILHNTKPVGHQDLVGLVISIILLGDFSLVLLTLLQLYSVSMAYVFLVLLILPLGILLPFPAGINALFSHGPRRSAGLARLYALWSINSVVNVGFTYIRGSRYKVNQMTLKVFWLILFWLNFSYGYGVDVKVLNVGDELFEETLPLRMGSRYYQLQGLKPNTWYEVKISYPASIPAVFSLELKKDISGVGVTRLRKLLNTEKLIFKAENLDEISHQGGSYVLITVEPEGVVALRGVRDRENILFNIVCDELVMGIPREAWLVVAFGVACIVAGCFVPLFLPSFLLSKDEENLKHVTQLLADKDS